ncbi:MAG: bifunctional diaminohydroxyphosphoribosylaminopyrimidine deaminase/5-amino-6-(5-phosphoribosylamino)uracil reductase RibD [Candidatus Eisenbacteria bacterium]|nr:bifunctional diaminohydroxyphosphoribosylaminopyrimidine deaminase/5-amino-6-(5-phosphoribosylamino)uracil reductase RibD [Candidatus Eisenbacteria bacterium]
MGEGEALQARHGPLRAAGTGARGARRNPAADQTGRGVRRAGVGIRPDRSLATSHPISGADGALFCAQRRSRGGRLESDLGHDARWMKVALSAARLGCGWTHPNPRVGAVAVRDGRLVGIGSHLRFGAEHAEAHLIRHAPAERVRGATLYVTLEPCCHQGQTPPCTRAIRAAGFSRVVSAVGDPAPHVCGGGFAELRGAGIEVAAGIRAAEALRLNAPYFWRQRCERSFVTLKMASSLDGRLATADGSSRWISSAAARERVQQWRAGCDALLVGGGTFAADRPRLTARPRRDPLRRLRRRVPGAQEQWPHQPARIVVDSRASIAVHDALLGHVLAHPGAPWVVACGAEAPREAVRALESAGLRVWRCPHPSGGARVDLVALLQRTASEGWMDVMVEGGAGLASALLAADLVDRLRLFLAPILLGGPRTWLGDLGVETLQRARRTGRPLTQRIGRDLLITTLLPPAVRRLQELREDPILACSPG